MEKDDIQITCDNNFMSFFLSSLLTIGVLSFLGLLTVEMTNFLSFFLSSLTTTCLLTLLISTALYVLNFYIFYFNCF